MEIERKDDGIATQLTAEHVSPNDMVATVVGIVNAISQETGDSTQKIFENAKRMALLEEMYQGNASPLDILKEVLKHG
ncbi:hypothetical protein FD01_GL000885 [Lacticaseibacillus manihotivorans DSM 13343 = JCM 12514]|uniref:Uncharacterized protein n=1 Tax=Lacticaseibacillus manihotivorans DSM 13343 = JCM 12514 TaxID=1423769 RepID=A0A0R1QJP4_9LACO|nr:hypothetical protein FD01_GL000885 [Lacticaseibacillus manihotivorans DSM 13343 = JCM 12514]